MAFAAKMKLSAPKKHLHLTDAKTWPDALSMDVLRTIKSRVRLPKEEVLSSDPSNSKFHYRLMTSRTVKISRVEKPKNWTITKFLSETGGEIEIFVKNIKTAFARNLRFSRITTLRHIRVFLQSDFGFKNIFCDFWPIRKFRVRRIRKIARWAIDFLAVSVDLGVWNPKKSGPREKKRSGSQISDRIISGQSWCDYVSLWSPPSHLRPASCVLQYV